MDADLDRLRRSLFEFCEDLGELEILARLRDVRGNTPLNETEIATLTGFTRELARDALRRLTERGLLAETGPPARYGYAVADTEVRARLDQVLDAYRRDPLAIMSMLTANAIERVRTAAIVTFAECFRFGGPKSRG